MLTAVLQDLGGSEEIKTVLYLPSKVLKLKIGNGFPQTSQSHETLCLIVQKPHKKDDEKQMLLKNKIIEKWK